MTRTVVRLVLCLALGPLLGGAPIQQPGPAAYHPPQWQPWTPTAPAPPPVPSPPATEAEPEPSPIIRIQFVTQDDVDRARAVNLTQLPGPERVFRMESEADLRERIRQDALRAGRFAPPFPAQPSLPAARPAVLAPPAVVPVEPAFVCHERLMFEEINSERHGWDFGGIQAVALTADFFYKVLTAPARRLVDHCRCYDCDVGLCLPGDPVPFFFRLSGR